MASTSRFLLQSNKRPIHSKILLSKTLINPIPRNSWIGLRNEYCLRSNLLLIRRLMFVPQSYKTYSNWKAEKIVPFSTPKYFSSLPIQRPVVQQLCGLQRWQPVRFMSNELVTLDTDDNVARFSLTQPNSKPEIQKKGTLKSKRPKMSKKAKVNQLKWYRLKAKKKMKSPNLEVRIRYKLEKAKRKEEWLIEKLRKFDMPKGPEPVHDPEILTEERFYLKRTGEKKKHYVPVGRRGVFGGVVLNMHLHWKNHETVKVICKPCRPGQVHEYATELVRLSKGTILGIKGHNIIIFYRGKNYVQPEIMSPPDTLSKNKALEKYKYEQSLEHTSQFIEKLEKELEEYHKHIAMYRKNREEVTSDKAHS